MRRTDMEPSFQDRCVGSLLGTACGDILGAAVEGWPASAIGNQFGKLRDFLDTERGFGCYTDDTQMTLALATSLVQRGQADSERISSTYAEFYQPSRGYGAAAHMVMQALRSGADHRETGRMRFEDGSFGNGGAMRIAPIGLAYRHAPDDALGKAVEAALLCTHVHPEAIDGAFIQAKAVAQAAAVAESSAFDAKRFLLVLVTLCETDIMRRKLSVLMEGIEEDASDDHVIAKVGNGIRTSEAVAAALWAFIQYGKTPENCVIRAVGFGGDTDTIGAMTGALVGALHGYSWIPERWYDNIENGEHGRDEIVNIARRLAAIDLVE